MRCLSPAAQRNPAHAGFEHLHSFAFLGRSGRIATASDGLFSYVPAGPNKQLDMFLRAYDLRKAGRIQARRPFTTPMLMLPDQATGIMMPASFSVCRP
jgi:hypothetical protein